jgi:hypothetical protein
MGVHPKTVARVLSSALPDDISGKIAGYVGSPTARLIRDHKDEHPEFCHWEIPRRFGNFIVDEVCGAYMCCCRPPSEIGGPKVTSYCTMCKIGLCPEHTEIGCWCNVLAGLQLGSLAPYLSTAAFLTAQSHTHGPIPHPVIDLCTERCLIRTSVYATGRYRLTSPTRKFFTKEHISQLCWQMHQTPRERLFSDP